MMYDKLIFELSNPGRIGFSLPNESHPEYDIADLKGQLRQVALNLPEVSELDCVRHYSNISKKNFGIENGFYPLGSCTMKYNPKINEEIVRNTNFARLHP